MFPSDERCPQNCERVVSTYLGDADEHVVHEADERLDGADASVLAVPDCDADVFAGQLLGAHVNDGDIGLHVAQVLRNLAPGAFDRHFPRPDRDLHYTKHNQNLQLEPSEKGLGFNWKLAALTIIGDLQVLFLKNDSHVAYISLFFFY